MACDNRLGFSMQLLTSEPFRHSFVYPLRSTRDLALWYSPEFGVQLGNPPILRIEASTWISQQSSFASGEESPHTALFSHCYSTVSSPSRTIKWTALPADPISAINSWCGFQLAVGLLFSITLKFVTVEESEEAPFLRESRNSSFPRPCPRIHGMVRLQLITSANHDLWKPSSSGNPLYQIRHLTMAMQKRTQH